MSRIILLFVCGMAAVIALLLAVRWLTGKARKKMGAEEVVELPLAIWIACIAGTGSVIMYRVLGAVSEAIDIWMKLKPGEFLKSIATSCCLMIGIGMGWLLLLAGIATGLVSLVLVTGAKKARKMEADQLAYAVIKGMLLLVVGVVLLPVIDGLLQMCMPAFNLSYFH